MKNKQGGYAGVIVLVLMALMLISVVVLALLIKPYFEMKSFNECTGGNAKLSTAIFTQLRIDECNIQNK